MPNQNTTITATLNVASNFTGRVLVYMENGIAIRHRLLFDDEHVACLDAFLDLARQAGLHVAPVGRRNA